MTTVAAQDLPVPRPSTEPPRGPAATGHDPGPAPSPSRPRVRRPAGRGTQRERRPGVWEVRVPVGWDEHTGRTRHRSVSVHGDEAAADAARERLLAHGVGHDGPGGPGSWRVADLLAAWLTADQPWRPSTLVGYRSVVRALSADPLGGLSPRMLTPDVVRGCLARWRQEGRSQAVVAGRFRVLRSALGWAYTERLLDDDPLRHMRGPGRCPPRLPLAEEHVRALVAAAELRVLETLANHPGPGDPTGHRQRAEQDLLMVRLAADTGARRGELAALRIDDLQGSVLRIDRADSAGQLTTPKSGHGRTLTVGATIAALWHRLAEDWAVRLPTTLPAALPTALPTATPGIDSGADSGTDSATTDTAGEATAGLGPWLFSADPGHWQRWGATTLGHRFTRLREAAGVPGATLHRLRHSVATFLVARGQVLQAQARLGHADAATTLREYAYALPLTDQAVADQIDRHLTPRPDIRVAPEPRRA